MTHYLAIALEAVGRGSTGKPRPTGFTSGLTHQAVQACRAVRSWMSVLWFLMPVELLCCWLRVVRGGNFDWLW